MKRKKIDLSQERKIITYMIVSDKFLREISKIIQPIYFESSYARTISAWVLEYWNEYKQNPGKNIQSIYEQKRKTIIDEGDILSKFLTRLSEDYEEESEINNIDYVIKTSISYLKIRSLSLLKDRLETAIQSDEPLAGEQAVANYTKVEQPISEHVDLLFDTESIASAFMEEDEILFRFPKALGDVIGNFVRGDLIAYMGASGKGKTWWLWYTALVSLYNGHKVVFFNIESPMNQIVRRAWQSLVARGRRTGTVEFPYFEKEDSKYIVKLEDREIEEVDAQSIKEQQNKFKSYFRSGNIKIISLPAYSGNMMDVAAHLDNLEYYDNFIPDVVIVDYADILAPTPGFRGDYRHQLDDIWKRMRRLAQDRNILTATATQADRKSFSKDASEANIVEDIRKLAHVSKMIALNQKPAEYKRGIMRVNLLKERDGKRSYKKAVVLQCLETGLVHIDSKFENEVII